MNADELRHMRSSEVGLALNSAFAQCDKHVLGTCPVCLALMRTCGVMKQQKATEAAHVTESQNSNSIVAPSVASVTASVVQNVEPSAALLLPGFAVGGAESEVDVELDKPYEVALDECHEHDRTSAVRVEGLRPCLECLVEAAPAE